MVVAGSETMVIASMWTSMAAWFTPTVLFCVTNLIIAIIFIASNNNSSSSSSSSSSNKHHDHGDSFTRIERVSSFLERARSMNLSSYNATITTTAAESQQYSSQLKVKPANYSSSSRLAQSIYVTPPEVSTVGELSQSESKKQLTRAPSLLQRVMSIKFSSVYNGDTFPTESEQICNSPGQLERVPSFFDRVKSFKISSAFNTGAPSTQPENVDPNPIHNPDHHVIRSKSDKTNSRKSKSKKPVGEIKKSLSEMRIAPEDDEDVDLRRPETARERRNTDDEEVDAKADDFISRFKQQLKLQRLESLVRYNEKLNRRSWN